MSIALPYNEVSPQLGWSCMENSTTYNARLYNRHAVGGMPWYDALSPIMNVANTGELPSYSAQ